MTCFDYSKYKATKNLINIGTSGKLDQATVDYTFKFISKIKPIVSFHGKRMMIFRKFNKKTRFWYYDRIFLDVLYYQKSSRITFV